MQGLIDSGAGGIFIHPKLVIQLWLEPHRLSRTIAVYNVDNTPNKIGRITQGVTILVTMGSETRKIQAWIADIGKEKLILGLPWLVKEDPDISFGKGTIRLRHRPSWMELKAIIASKVAAYRARVKPKSPDDYWNTEPYPTTSGQKLPKNHPHLDKSPWLDPQQPYGTVHNPITKHKVTVEDVPETDPPTGTDDEPSKHLDDQVPPVPSPQEIPHKNTLEELMEDIDSDEVIVSYIQGEPSVALSSPKEPALTKEHIDELTSLPVKPTLNQFVRTKDGRFLLTLSIAKLTTAMELA